MAPSLIAPDPNARPECFRNLFEEVIFVFTVMMATASTTFIQGAIIINTEGIGRDLNMTPAQITWIAAAIGLASGSFMLFFGKTSDSFGPKLQLLTGMALLSASSLITAFVPNPIFMNVLCGFLGLGTAAVSPPAIGALFATYPEGKRRNKVTGALGAGNPVGFILGSISSGLSAKYSNWRTSFVVISVFFFVLTLLTVWTVPTIPRTGSTRTMMKQFDYLGTVLTILGMALLAAGLTEGPEIGWNSFEVVLLLILGIACIFGFVAWENRYKYPLLDPSVWKNKTFTMCVLCIGFGYMSFITNQFWISLYMQSIQLRTPLDIAIRLLPQAVAGIIWSYVGQAAMSRFQGRTIMGIGGVAYLIGATLQVFIKPDTIYWRFLFPALCITVIGADFQFIVSNLYVSQQMPTQAALGAGVPQTAMRLSVSFGLALSSAVYGSVSKTTKGRTDVTIPFERAYICSIAFAATGLLFVPFMKIRRQGKHSQNPSMEEEEGQSEEYRPRTAGDYLEHQLLTDGSYPDLLGTGERRIITYKPSEASLWTMATAGTQDSFFPRWSWEEEIIWPDDRTNHKHGTMSVAYEVCLKCMEERKVIVIDGGVPGLSQIGYPHSHGNTQVPNFSLPRRDSRGHTAPFQQHNGNGSWQSSVTIGRNEDMTPNPNIFHGVHPGPGPGEELNPLPPEPHCHNHDSYEASWPGHLSPLGDPSWHTHSNRAMHLDGVGGRHGIVSGNPVDGLLHYLNRYERLLTPTQSQPPQRPGRGTGFGLVPSYLNGYSGAVETGGEGWV